MSKTTRCAKVVDLAETRAPRLLTEIRETPVPADAEAAIDLARQTAGHLAAQPGGLLRLRMAVAAHDLEDLIDLLEAELATLAGELRTVNRHTSAAATYARTADAVRSL